MAAGRYRHPDVNAGQRALVGVIFIFHIYKNRLSLYNDLVKRVDLMDEISPFKEDVARIYHQMLLCQETEKIDKKNERREIIPEMLKNVSSMRNMRFGFEENGDENDDKNPDWADAFEQSGLGDKLREMNELQLEGSRRIHEYICGTESYPFFRKYRIGFTRSASSNPMIKQLKQEGNEKNTLLDLISSIGIFQ